MSSTGRETGDAPDWIDVALSMAEPREVEHQTATDAAAIHGTPRTAWRDAQSCRPGPRDYIGKVAGLFDPGHGLGNHAVNPRALAVAGAQGEVRPDCWSAHGRKITSKGTASLDTGPPTRRFGLT